MRSKVAQNALNRISTRIPGLKPGELALIEVCLEECFEVGKAWDDVPILINEAKQPMAASPKPKT